MVQIGEYLQCPQTLQNCSTSRVWDKRRPACYGCRNGLIQGFTLNFYFLENKSLGPTLQATGFFFQRPRYTRPSGPLAHSTPSVTSCIPSSLGCFELTGCCSLYGLLVNVSCRFVLAWGISQSFAVSRLSAILKMQLKHLVSCVDAGIGMIYLPRSPL